jgi:hypothetical protein
MKKPEAQIRMTTARKARHRLRSSSGIAARFKIIKTN